MKCSYHPEHEAVVKCADCGKEICNLCLTTTAFSINAAHLVIPLADKRYCPACIEKLINENVKKSPNLNKKPIVLVPETFSQETAAVAPMKAGTEIKSNIESAPDKVPKESVNHSTIVTRTLFSLTTRLLGLMLSGIAGAAIAGFGYYLAFVGWNLGDSKLIIPILGILCLGFGILMILAAIVMIFLPRRTIDKLSKK